MKHIRKKNASAYNYMDILIAFVIGVLAFLLAYKTVVLAIALTAFFTFINISRIDRKTKELEKKLMKIENRNASSVDSIETDK